MKDLLLLLQETYGIQFTDMSLLRNAFTHSSYANEERLPKTANNERLEFLGDAALQLVISEWLYKNYPDKQEGELSKMRASIVRSESLADFSRRCNFDRYILLGRGEEKTDGRQKDSILEDLFEAFLGALLEDQGINQVRQFLHEVVIPNVEKGDYERVTDYKTALQEVLQMSGDIAIEYQVLSESGSAHAREFVIGVFENGRKLGEGKGHSKKLAEQSAAASAFEAAKGGLNVS
jgi:ribonuclease-3